MHRISGIIAAIAAVLGFLALAIMFYGSSQSMGMAILFFQIWGVIFSVAGICFGVLSRLLARREPVPPSRSSDIGIGLGLGCLLALLIVMMLS